MPRSFFTFFWILLSSMPLLASLEIGDSEKSEKKQTEVLLSHSRCDCFPWSEEAEKLSAAREESIAPAIDDERDVLRFPPLRVQGKEAQREWLLLERAEALEKKESFAESEPLWRELLDHTPDNPAYQYGLGRNLYKQDQTEEAFPYLKRAYEANPEDADILLFLSYSYLRLGEPEKAREGFRKILEEHPEYTDAAEGLSLANRALEKPAEEEKKVAKEKEKKKEDPFTAEEKSWIKCAESLMKKGKYDQALLFWLPLHHLFPDQERFLYDLGYTQYLRGRWKRSFYWLDRTLKKNPDNALAKLRLGYLYLSLQHYGTAQQIFGCLLQKSAKDNDARFALGQTLERSLFRTQAKWFYQDAYAQDKKSKDISDALFRVMHYTNPWFRSYNLYAFEEETDVFTKQKAARRYALLNGGTCYVPLSDTNRASFRYLQGWEKEQNLVNKDMNYNTSLGSSELGFETWPFLRWRAVARFGVKQGEPRGDPAAFPFRPVTKLEPSGSLTYSTPWNQVTYACYLDSYIVKNFVANFSYLQSRRTLSLEYQYQFFPLEMYAGILGYSRTWQAAPNSPANYERRVVAWLEVPCPKYLPWLSFRYQYEEGGFTSTSTFYYSFRHQWDNLLKVFIYQRNWKGFSYVNFSYVHGFRKSRDLNQPVNTAVFLRRQFLNTNWFEVQAQKRVGHSFLFEIIGRLYFDSADYFAWSIHPSIEWVF